MAGPRDLSVVPDEEELVEIDQRKLHLNKEISAMGSIVGMFRSKGWERVRAELFGQLQAAHQALLDNRVTTMEGIAFVRGQIHAFQYLFNLGDEAQQRMEFYKSELQQVSEEADTLS